MVRRILTAFFVAIVAWIVILAIALLLGLTGFPPAEAIAGFLRQMAVLIALLFGVAQFMWQKWTPPWGN